MYNQSHDIKINGPINVVRMEGIFDSIKKIIYIFMDYHIEYDNQSKCDDPQSINVNKFFFDSFMNLKNADHMYDFF
jgi:hypothetical protein